MKTEIMENSNGLSKDFKNKVQSVEKSIKEMTSDIGEKVGATTAGLVDTASDQIKSGKAYVKENPLKALGIAAAVGLAVGSLMTLVRRSR